MVNIVISLEAINDDENWILSFNKKFKTTYVKNEETIMPYDEYLELKKMVKIFNENVYGEVVILKKHDNELLDLIEQVKKQKVIHVILKPESMDDCILMEELIKEKKYEEAEYIGSIETEDLIAIDYINPSFTLELSKDGKEICLCSHDIPDIHLGSDLITILNKLSEELSDYPRSLCDFTHYLNGD